MDYPSYKVMHLLGVALVVFALGGFTLHTLNGGNRKTNPNRTFTAITHGIGMALIFVAGFGMMARIGIPHAWPWPAWLQLKLVIWLTMGAMMTLTQRFPALGRVVWFAIPLLAATSAYLALFKPWAAPVLATP